MSSPLSRRRLPRGSLGPQHGQHRGTSSADYRTRDGEGVAPASLTEPGWSATSGQMCPSRARSPCASADRAEASPPEPCTPSEAPRGAVPPRQARPAARTRVCRHAHLDGPGTLSIGIPTARAWLGSADAAPHSQRCPACAVRCRRSRGNVKKSALSAELASLADEGVATGDLSNRSLRQKTTYP